MGRARRAAQADVGRLNRRRLPGENRRVHHAVMPDHVEPPSVPDIRPPSSSEPGAAHILGSGRNFIRDGVTACAPSRAALSAWYSSKPPV